MAIFINQFILTILIIFAITTLILIITFKIQNRYPSHIKFILCFIFGLFIYNLTLALLLIFLADSTVNLSLILILLQFFTGFYAFPNVASISINKIATQKILKKTNLKKLYIIRQIVVLLIVVFLILNLLFILELVNYSCNSDSCFSTYRIIRRFLVQCQDIFPMLFNLSYFLMIIRSENIRYKQHLKLLIIPVIQVSLTIIRLILEICKQKLEIFYIYQILLYDLGLIIILIYEKPKRRLNIMEIDNIVNNN